ncbi:unnamed protein product [Fusarium graminearum]|nr:unnamed protein product [Fusarium graminearum]
MATEVPQNELIPDIVYETENDNYVEFSLSPSPSRPHPPPMVQLSPSVAGKSRFKWANDGIHGSPLRSESANEVTSSATLRRIPTVQFVDVTIFQGGFYSAVTAGGKGGWLCFCDGTGEADTQDVTVHRHISPHIGLSPPFLMHIKGEGSLNRAPQACSLRKVLVVQKRFLVGRLDQTEARDREVCPAFSSSQQ